MEIVEATISEVHNYNSIKLTVRFDLENEDVEEQITKLRQMLHNILRRVFLSEDAQKELNNLRQKSEITHDDIRELPDHILHELIASGKLFYDMEAF